MNREEKAAAIEEIGEEIKASEAIFAIDYRGISVSQAAELRNGLRDADATFKVVKNRLTKIAAEQAGVTGLDAVLEGPTALTFVKGDTAQAAKAITTFNKEHDVLTYKGGLMGEAALDEGQFTAIAKLPSRDRLNAQLAGVVASPLVTLTRGLGSMISGLAIQLQQVAEQGLVGGSTPAEEAKAEEPAAEEAPAAEAEAPAEEAGSEETAEAEAPAEEAASEEAPEAESEAPAEDAGAEEAADEEPGAEEPASEEPEAGEASSGEAQGEGEEGGSDE